MAAGASLQVTRFLRRSGRAPGRFWVTQAVSNGCDPAAASRWTAARTRRGFYRFRGMAGSDGIRLADQQVGGCAFEHGSRRSRRSQLRYRSASAASVVHTGSPRKSRKSKIVARSAATVLSTLPAPTIASRCWSTSSCSKSSNSCVVLSRGPEPNDQTVAKPATTSTRQGRPLVISARVPGVNPDIGSVFASGQPSYKRCTPRTSRPTTCSRTDDSADGSSRFRMPCRRPGQLGNLDQQVVLGRTIQQYIGDQDRVWVRAPAELRTDRLPDGAPGSVAADRPRASDAAWLVAAVANRDPVPMTTSYSAVTMSTPRENSLGNELNWC